MSILQLDSFISILFYTSYGMYFNVNYSLFLYGPRVWIKQLYIHACYRYRYTVYHQDYCVNTSYESVSLSLSLSLSLSEFTKCANIITYQEDVHVCCANSCNMWIMDHTTQQSPRKSYNIRHHFYVIKT